MLIFNLFCCKSIINKKKLSIFTVIWVYNDILYDSSYFELILLESQYFLGTKSYNVKELNIVSFIDFLYKIKEIFIKFIINHFML